MSREDVATRHSFKLSVPRLISPGARHPNPVREFSILWALSMALADQLLRAYRGVPGRAKGEMTGLGPATPAVRITAQGLLYATRMFLKPTLVLRGSLFRK